MKQEKELELKMLLFDNISKAQDSIDVINIRKETECVFECLKLITDLNSTILDDERSDVLLEDGVHDAILSYDIIPNLEINDRVNFIQGIMFASYNSVLCSTMTPIFDLLAIPQKQEVLLELFNCVLKERDIELDERSKSYMMLGITSSLAMSEVSRKNRKK